MIIRRVSMCWMVAGSLIILRLSLIGNETKIISLRVMSAINSIAFVFVVCTVLIRAYDEMVKLHDRIGLNKNNHPPINRSMMVFKNRKNISIVFLSIGTFIYIAFLGYDVVNDILTILALMISIEDNTLAKWLCDISYHDC